MLSQQLTHRTLIRYDEHIGHRFVSNLTMRMPYSENPYFIKTNTQGFRANFDYGKKKAKDEIRVVFLGDSFTAGDGVANEKRFSDLVAQKYDIQSYNFGLSGSGVDQQYLIYKNIAHHYEHDMLVISPHICDITRNQMRSRTSIERKTRNKILVPKPYFTLDNDQLALHNVPVPKDRQVIQEDPYKEVLFLPPPYLRKLFHQFIPKTLKENLLKIQYKNSIRGYKNSTNPDWLLMKKLIEAIIQAAGDIPIILSPLPYHRVLMNPNYQAGFLKIAEQFPNVHYIDILEKFKTISDTDKLFYHRDGHYSEYGHQVVAEALIEAIGNNHLLKKTEKQIPKNIPVKKATYILGISAFYHDSACALIKNGKIIAAAQEERFSRIKNDPQFPYQAINYCLEEAKIHVHDLDAIAYYDHPYLTFERIIASQLRIYPEGKALWQEILPRWAHVKLHIPAIIHDQLNYSKNVYLLNHHLSHASSAYYASPYEEAAILTIDGVGEWATATIGYGKNTNVKIIKEMIYPNSVGLLYSAFTYYCGFQVNEGEYKLMGLAPYGEPKYADLIKENIVTIHEDGSITLHLEYFGFQQSMRMVSGKFEELLGGPARKKEETITRRIMDIAKSIQVVTEEIIIKMARHAKQITGASYLCLAGGVALNCVANGKLLREGIFADLWIQPAAGDAGGALGAAMYLYYSKFAQTNERKPTNPPLQQGSYLGVSYTDEEILAFLESYDYHFTKLEPSVRNTVVAQYLSEGKIVGHFSGRCEFGPRALGARSILGDPRDEKAQSTLNLKIKFRESFRPFAPTVLEEDISTYFEIDRPSPYMLLVANVKKERCLENKPVSDDIIQIVNNKRSDLPAITHVDYSARIQSICKKDNYLYFDLISEFKKITGYGVIINTSFNVNGEPIVCSPEDAVHCFMHTEMDVLIMNNFLLLKEKQKKPSAISRQYDSPQHERPNKTLIKLQKNAEKIFENHFGNYPDFKMKKQEERSTWQEYKIGKEVDMFDANRQLRIEDMLSTWTIFTDSQKHSLKPLISEITKLSHYKKEVVEPFDTNVYDSIYVMF